MKLYFLWKSMLGSVKERGVIKDMLKHKLNRVISNFVLIFFVLTNVLLNCDFRVRANVIQDEELVIQGKQISIRGSNININGLKKESAIIPDLNQGIINSLEKDTVLINESSYNQKEIKNNNSLYCANDYKISTKTALISKIIVVNNNLTINSSSLNSLDNTILYAKNGNITVNTNDMKFSGILYAPNGTITLNGSKLNINGIIIADKINIYASNFTIISNSYIKSLVDKLEYMHIDNVPSLMSTYNSELDSITSIWTEDSNISYSDIYIRYNNQNEFVKLNSTNEFKYTFKLTNDFDYIDLRVVSYTKYGDVLKSTISTLEKTDNNSIKNIIHDSDDDKIPDGYEIWDLNTNPNDFDSDKDCLPDGYEALILYTDPVNYTNNEDFDNDGINNKEELNLNTNPYVQDSDFDGLTDNVDEYPLKTLINSNMSVNYNIPINYGVYDIVNKYIDENGIKNYSIYNYITQETRYNQVDDNSIVTILNSNYEVTGYIEKKDEIYTSTNYTYIDNRISSLTTNGICYDFKYDDLGNIISVAVNGNLLISNNFINGILISSEYGNQQTNNYVYDTDNRICGLIIDGRLSFEWSYDDFGNISSCNDLINNVQYNIEYNSDNNISRISNNKDFELQYSSEENKSSVTYKVGNSVKTQCTNLVDNGIESNTLITETTLISGDKWNNIQSGDEQIINSINTDETEILNNKYYSDNGLLSKIQYKDGTILEYIYDDNNNISAIKENGETKNTYHYDDSNQLIYENNLYTNETYEYLYDNRGNILLKNVYDDLTNQIKSTSQYEYQDDWADLLTSYNGKKIIYDDIGNPVSYYNGMQFNWSNGRQLANINNKELNISYQYNIDGFRTYKKVNDKETTYLWEGDKIIAEITGEDKVWYIYNDLKVIIGFESNDISYYYIKNVQGDVIKIIDERGNEICGYIYNAWGKIISTTGDENIANINPIRYRSYYYDKESGYYYLLTRYYDPTTGRFLNADTAFENYNLFIYCNNNPVTRSDYNGMTSYEAINYNIYAISSYGYAGVGWKDFTFNGVFYLTSSGKYVYFNCYMWALKTYALSSSDVKNPGDYSGLPLDRTTKYYTVNDIVNRVLVDVGRAASIVSSPTYYTSGSKYLVAVRVTSEYDWNRNHNYWDYHFMRRIGNTWTFKAGRDGRIFDLKSGYNPSNVTWNAIMYWASAPGEWAYGKFSDGTNLTYSSPIVYLCFK